MWLHEIFFVVLIKYSVGRFAFWPVWRISVFDKSGECSCLESCFDAQESNKLYVFLNDWVGDIKETIGFI